MARANFHGILRNKSLTEWSSRVYQVRSGIARRAALETEVCTHPTSVGTEQAVHGRECEPTKAPGVRIAILHSKKNIAMSVADRTSTKPAVAIG